MPYDRQLVAIIHPKSLPNGQTLIDGANALKSAKAITDVVALDPTVETVPIPDQNKFASLTGASRLYLFAHGDRRSGTIGGVAPEKLAKFLMVRCDLSFSGKIVLVACGSVAGVEATKKSHQALRPIRAKVYAYTKPIKVIDAEDMKLVKKLTDFGLTKLDWKLGERRLLHAQGNELTDWKKPRATTDSKYVLSWSTDEYGDNPVQKMDSVF